MIDWILIFESEKRFLMEKLDLFGQPLMEQVRDLMAKQYLAIIHNFLFLFEQSEDFTIVQ